MYTRAIAVGLDFLKTPDDVYQAAVGGKLKLFSVTEDVELDEVRYPFVLPQTLDFITQLGKQYHDQCGDRLVVTSGARPVDQQPRNAVRESVHPTGMAVDFHRPAEPCLTWLRKALVVLEDRGVIEATEEHRPPHFHVAVLRRASNQYAVDVDLGDRKADGHVAATSNGEVASADSVNCPKDTAKATSVIATATESTTAKPDSSRAKAPSRSVTNAKPSASERRASPAAKQSASTRAKVSAYRVKPGDNLSTIALRHHTTVKRLQELNHLRTTKVRSGQQLRVP
jgi:LysM repeat protein